MRFQKEESSRIFSVYLPTSLYIKVLNKAGKGSVSTFIKSLLEKELEGEEQKQKEQLKQRLIKDYQSQTKNKKFQKESLSWEKSQFTDLGNE